MEFEIGKEYLHLGHFVKLESIEGDSGMVANRFEEHAVVRLCELKPKETRGQRRETKNRLFIRCPGSDEIWCHCGDNVAEAKAAVGHMLEADIEILFNDPGMSFSADFEIRQMTDAEVEALPDI